MTVARKGTSITMTADADAATGAFWIAGVTFQCSGSAAGERLRLTDTAGDVIADYLVSAATDNADLWSGRNPHLYHGLLVEDFPSGTGVLTIFLE
jgi:hypothetical protein